ncbi:MAG: enoyl-CoA hydratase/isomerase family protein [Proteobacteria bacterium]|nr:enoyl-CoA hydratase/isomerase family protein [Pseudomonadota bacterium]
MEPAVKVHSADGVGWITLNRPTTINAINDAIRTGVPAALDAFDRDDAIRVIVLQGSGSRGFCAGADIKENKPIEGPVEARAGAGLRYPYRLCRRAVLVAGNRPRADPGRRWYAAVAAADWAGEGAGSADHG